MNNKFSFFNDKWCSSISTQIHEVGAYDNYITTLYSIFWMDESSYLTFTLNVSYHVTLCSFLISHRIVLYCIVSFRAGHNLNLGHSNQIKEGEYEDLTGFMGLSFLEQQGAKQCFNPSKSYQL